MWTACLEMSRLPAARNRMAASQGLMSAAAKTALVNSPNACPFCGSPRTALQEIDLGSWMTECLDCHATGPAKPSAMAAEQAWNRRISYPGPLG